MNGGTTPLAPEDPERIGRYRILGRLGQGGMGRVFLAEDAEGHRVAVKLVHAEFTADPEFRRRFGREVEAAGKVLSFFTVPLVDSEADAETPWLATQYVSGPSLSAAVRRDGPLPVDRLCSLAAALGEALIVIHAAGIVHRDLKPSNVLLADDGPRVIDFGIARAADSEELTRAGHALGTLGYAPPEQVVAEEPVGAAGDVFSLGGVMLYAATGRQPFGDAPPAVLAYRTVYEEPDIDGVPEELTVLVRRCLAKDPASRPTPREVIAAARAAQSRVRDGSPAPARAAEEPTSYRIAPPAPVSPPAPSPVPESRPESGPEEPRRRRRGVLTAAAVAVAVAALAVAGAIYLPDRGGDKQNAGGGTSGRAGIGPAAEGADPLPDVTAKGDRRAVWTAQRGISEVDSEVMGAWLTPKALVRIDASGIRAFASRTGTPEWTVAPPAKGLVPCGASDAGTATSGAVGLVRFGRAYTSPAACDVAAALDSATGKLLWHRRVGEAPMAVASVSGDIMVVSGEKGILGLDRATGAHIWTYPWTRGDCEVDDAVPGVRTVAVSDTCDREDTDAERVVELDIATGKVRTTHEIERSGATAAKVVAAEPVVARYTDVSGDDFLRVLSSEGGKPLDLPVKQAFGTLSLNRSLVAKGVLVTEAESGPGGTARGLVAIDLTTGKVRWHTGMREEVLELEPLRIQGDSVYIVEGEDTDGPANWSYTVRRRSLADGTVTESGQLPAPYLRNHPDRLLASGGLVVQVNTSDKYGLAAFDTAPDDGS
ncbi:serine/threonine-protein kinase [Streptomyces sp. Caat 7-52]|uniref:serine/threonine-protein kinase n=1 Tax=Streptomyces sp. Caat 7-52 TaxID=2949637 RepID=UPI0020358CE6|nr:serine/threonine-protein kinase [Streptomyces sp. Caat 7-52]